MYWYSLISVKYHWYGQPRYGTYSMVQPYLVQLYAYEGWRGVGKTTKSEEKYILNGENGLEVTGRGGWGVWGHPRGDQKIIPGNLLFTVSSGMGPVTKIHSLICNINIGQKKETHDHTRSTYWISTNCNLPQTWRSLISSPLHNMTYIHTDCIRMLLTINKYDAYILHIHEGVGKTVECWRNENVRKTGFSRVGVSGDGCQEISSEFPGNFPESWMCLVSSKWYCVTTK